MLRLTPWLIAASFVGCKSCIGCVDPDMPSDPNQPHIGDTSPEDSGDTGETAPPEDTTPPPPCDVPEVEPNESPDEAFTVPLESTACGSFQERGDSDRMIIPAEDAQWIRIDVDAAAIGSSANVSFALTAWESGEYAMIVNRTFEEDPWIVFPVLGDAAYDVTLYEESGQGGDDLEWELLASEDKAPVDWTVQESSNNNLCKNAQTIKAGDVVLGWLDEDFDYDWYHVEVPSSVDKINWTFQIEAYTKGSPLASRLSVWYVMVFDLDDVDFLATSFEDGDTNNRDPKIELSTEGEGDLYLVVQKPSLTSDPSASAFHWYTLSINNDLE